MEVLLGKTVEPRRLAKGGYFVRLMVVHLLE